MAHIKERQRLIRKAEEEKVKGSMHVWCITFHIHSVHTLYYYNVQ